ncbi:MAG TPA: cache domain-containing protein, partial [Coleofasciculaceae cyanobacterium]
MTLKLHARHFCKRWLHLQPDQGSKIPLQVVLTIPFVVQVVGIVGLVGYLSYQSGQQAVSRLVQQLVEEVGDRVELYISDYLKTPPLINRLNANAFRLGYLDPDRPQQIKQHFLYQLQEFNSTRVYFSSPQGGLISTGKDERGLTTAVTDRLARGTLSVYGVDRQGNRRQLLFQQPNYDARQRPFYQAAMTVGRPTWTPIFVYIPASRGLGIAASYPLYDSNRQLQGVLSSDLSLGAIHNFLQTLPLGSHGGAFIMERSGLIVAASSTEAPLTDPSNSLNSEKSQQNQQNQRIVAVNSKNPLIRTTARYLRSQFGDFSQIPANTHRSFEMNGDRQVLQVSPIRDELGLDWLLVTVVPESNFTTELEANLYRTVLLCGLALVGSIGLGVWTSRRIARSLLRLTQATQAVATGTLDRPLPATRLAEVSTLATSFRQMVGALQAADQLRQTYAADLERQVAEKTTALTEAQRIAQVGSWEFDVATGRSTWSAEQFNITGVDRALGEPPYSKLFELIPPDDRPALQAAVREAIDHGTPYTIEHRFLRPDGSISYAVSRGEAITNAQGQVIKLIGTTANITDRKKMEIA